MAHARPGRPPWYQGVRRAGGQSDRGACGITRRPVMKAILLTRTGDPSVLEYVDIPTPQPNADEVLVKAHTIGVSRPELLVRAGTYKWMPTLPAIPGIEMAGTVAEIGAGAGNLTVGQKVYVSARELPQRAGCYAEYISVPQRAL